jgi:hypothetical protein
MTAIALGDPATAVNAAKALMIDPSIKGSL